MKLRAQGCFSFFVELLGFVRGEGFPGQEFKPLKERPLNGLFFGFQLKAQGFHEGPGGVDDALFVEDENLFVGQVDLDLGA